MKAFSFILFSVFLFSCEEDTYRMDKRARFIADSLFQIEYQSIVKEQDSICELRKQASLKSMVDSIVIIRKQEIIQLQKGL